MIKKYIKKELDRQNEGIELIASENFVSRKVLKTTGSILTNKYAEGYPGRRYYGGCENVDVIEKEAQNAAKKLFNCKFANVQPHSGSQANAAAYRALLPDGGKIMTLTLNDGGHLTHGSPVSFSSHMYDIVHYPLVEGRLDYKLIMEMAVAEKPDLIVAGYSAYPYAINFAEFGRIKKAVGCKLMVDMAHIAGLVAVGEHMSPFPHADVVTSTTHKTLRGPRGGLILTNDFELYKKINSAVFPFYQGGPLLHVIAAKGVAFQEALKPSFKKYIKRVRENTRRLAIGLESFGVKVSETDTHLFLVDVLASFGLTGKMAEKKLDEIGITTNKNMIPNDTKSPAETSGLRIGAAAITTRGAKPKDMIKVSELIYFCLSEKLPAEEIEIAVKKLTSKWKRVQKL